MKQATEILKYLDEYYAAMIQRPGFFAKSPADLEGIVFFVEDLRAYILEDPEQAERYTTFLHSLGFGVTGCSHVPGTPETRTDEDLALFDKVADVLKRFLMSQHRYLESDEELKWANGHTPGLGIRPPSDVEGL